MAANSFIAAATAYKKAIDADIASYAAYISKMTLEQYGQYAALEVDTFLDLLTRGGKRMRGMLVLVGYEMCGGSDRAMILQAARSTEMIHTYILMIDDIQDRSGVRRGKPSAHEALAAYHRAQHFKGDAAHIGVSLALNAALAGLHAAEAILANLDVEPQLRLNALSITNRTMGITVHGQTYDIMNEVVEQPKAEDMEHVLDWKSAQYSTINPLHVGMVLAGAGCEQTNAITPYAYHIGRAFQLTDDMMGVFGDQQEIGKNPMDDIREGKRTLLMEYALQHATAAGSATLQQHLGNPKLTTKEFAAAKQIIEASGARRHIQERIDQEVKRATDSLQTGTRNKLWDAKSAAFLEAMARYIGNRHA